MTRHALPNRLSAAVVAASLAAGAATASPSARSIWMPEGFAYPNGIAFEATGGLLVGSVVSGDIATVGLGEPPAVRFAETERRFAGTALRLDAERGLLWVASPDFLGRVVDGAVVRRPNRLAVVDAATGETAWSAPMPEGGFANDIALDGRGGAFVTDTTLGRVLHLAEPGAPFEIVADGLESTAGGLGPAGIALAADASLIVGIYGDGRLLRVRPGGREGEATIEAIALAAPIANPDGLAFGPDGRLLAIDGAVASGDGRLVAVDLSGAAPHGVEPLVSGLDLPVNLAVRDRLVAITESRIRHRMIDEPTLLAPERFRVVLLDLGPDAAR
ncbi:MAG: hypothetical protein ACFBWO_04945 [Paracoccaceae bacterium]